MTQHDHRSRNNRFRACSQYSAKRKKLLRDESLEYKHRVWLTAGGPDIDVRTTIYKTSVHVEGGEHETGLAWQSKSFSSRTLAA